MGACRHPSFASASSSDGKAAGLVPLSGWCGNQVLLRETGPLIASLLRCTAVLAGDFLLGWPAWLTEGPAVVRTLDGAALAADDSAC